MDENDANDSVLLESPVEESCAATSSEVPPDDISVLDVAGASRDQFDVDLWQPVVRVRGSSSRQNSSKMRIRVRKVLPIRKWEAKF